MAVKIYGIPFSTCTKRVTMLLEELQVPYELQQVDIWNGANKTPEYLKMQPFGEIPVLEDSDLDSTIFESRAILRYLANKYPEKGLAGTDATSRALVDNWLEAEAANFNPHVSMLVGQRVFAAMKGRQCDDAKAAAAIEGLEGTLDILDKQLATRHYLAGDSFSIADIAAMPYLALTISHAGEAQLIAKRPNVQAWADRIFSRESWKTLDARAPLPSAH